MDPESPPIIPQEVEDLIIDILADQWSEKLDQQSRKALATCLLVSTAFWQSARSHVFKQITWREPFVPSFFEVFENDTLQDIKPVTDYVREISIAVNPKSPSITQQDAELYSPWVPLSHILDRAKNLVSLSLRSNSNRTSFNWDQLHSTAKDAVRNKCQSVTTLRFHRIANFPLEVLAECVLLRSLHLGHIDEVCGKQCDWNPKSLVDLEVLDINTAEGALSTIQATLPLGLTKLKHFKFLPSKDWIKDTSILRRATDSIERLSFTDFVDVTGPLRGIRLSEFGALRFLCARSQTIPFDESDDDPELPTFLLSSLITDLPPNSLITLEEIRIELVVYTDVMPAYTEYQQILREEKWANIDEFLTGPQYPFLKKVHIAFWDIFLGVYRFYNWDYQESASCRQWFQDCARRILPRTHSSSIEMEVDHFVFGSTMDPPFQVW